MVSLGWDHLGLMTPARLPPQNEPPCCQGHELPLTALQDLSQEQLKLRAGRQKAVASCGVDGVQCTVL